MSFGTANVCRRKRIASDVVIHKHGINAIIDKKSGTKISTKWPKLTPILLRKPSSIGWVKPSKGSIIIKNKNPFITSFRKLLKMKHPFVDAERKIVHTMPARFSEKLDMYGFEFLWTAELDPKVISKLIYIITVLGYGVTDANKVENLRSSDIDNSYVGLNKPTKGYKMFDDNFKQKPIADHQSFDFDMEQCGKETLLLQKIKANIDKQGGWIRYCLNNSKNRPDAFGQIKIGKELEITPCGLVPTKLCKFCGTINIYSQYPAGNGVHFSVKHYDPKWCKMRKENKLTLEQIDMECNVDKNNFFTKFNNDGSSEVMWRCCACQGDLNTQVVTTLAEIWVLVQHVWKALFVLCGQLDELMKMGYGDIYDELNEMQKLTIRSHDKAIIKEYFFHLRQKVIMCGNDLDRLTRSHLTKNMTNLFVTHDTRMNSIKPELMAEVSLANKTITQSTREADHEIRYNIIPNFSDNKLHNSKYCDWIFKNTYMDTCNVPGTCAHDTKRFIYYGFAGCSAPILELILTCCVQYHTYIIMPILDDKGSFKDGSSFVKTYDGKIDLFLSGSNQPLTFNEDTFGILNNFDCMIYDNKLFFITTEVKFDFVQIKMITGPYDTIDQLPSEKNKTIKSKLIKLNLPSIEGIMGNWTGFNFKEVHFNLDMKLFRALCIRNLSGKVSFENAREFAVGYSIRNFIIHSKQVLNAQIQYTDIDVHVILSQICMMTLRSNYANSIRYTEWSRYLGPLRTVIPNIDHKLTNLSLYTMTELLHYTTGLELTTIIELLSQSHINRWVQGFCTADFWNNLLMMADEVNTEPTKFYKIGTSQKLPPVVASDYKLPCMHHKDDCDHEDGDNQCPCCGMQCHTIYCACCTKEDDLGFWSFKDMTVKDDKPKDTFDDTINKIIKPTTLSKSTYNKFEPVDRIISDEAFEMLKAKSKSTEFQTEISSMFNITNRPPYLKEGVKNSELIEKIIRSDEGFKEDFKSMIKDQDPKLNEEVQTTDSGVCELEVGQEKELLTTYDAEFPTLKPTVITTQSKPTSVWKDVTYKKLKPIKEVSTIMQEFSGNKVTGELKELINDVLPVIGGRFVMHVLDPMKYENDLSSELEFNYVIEHCFPGITMLPRDTFKVIKTHDVANTDSMTCGYDAYVNATKSNMSLDNFRRITGLEQEFNQFNLLDAAEAEGKNMIILTVSEALIGKYNLHSDEFACVSLLPPEPPATIGHFVKCKILRATNHPMMLAVKDPEDGEARRMVLRSIGYSQTELYQPSSITPKDILEVEWKVATLHKKLKDVYTIKVGAYTYIRNGKKYISNNTTKNHDMSRGDFNIECDEVVSKMVPKAITVINSDCEEDSIPGQFDKCTGLPDDLYKFRNDYINDLLRQLCRARSLDFIMDKQNVRGVATGRLIPWKGASKLIITDDYNTKLKVLDKVMLEVNNTKHVVSVVDREKEGLMVDYPSLTEQKVKIIECKLSYGSTLRNLIAMIKPLIDPAEFRKILNSTTVILGPAGSGKSTEIANRVEQNDVVLAMTSEAVNNLRSKINKTKQVFSVEKFKTLIIERDYNLYIDEATMLDWVALWQLVRENTVVRLYGSDRQVGFIDTSITPGVRTIDSIMSVIPDNNKLRLNSTFRLGNPLVQKIQCLDPTLVSNADHDTELTISRILWDDKQKIKDMIEAIKPNVVLCMYNRVKSELTALLPNCKNLIHTTHSFQGNEVNKAVVVLKSERQAEWGLNGNPDYLYSAVTRAKEYCKIIVVDKIISEPYNIEQLITMRGGDDTNIMDEDLITIDTMWNLNEDEVKTLNDLKLEISGAKLQYEKIPNGVVCVAKIFNKQVAKITNKDGAVTIEGSDLVVRKINAARNKPLEMCRKDLRLNNRAKTVNLSLRSSNKIKELGWLIDKHPQGKMTLKLGSSYVTISKTAGCPTMSGYKFEENGNKIKISHAWSKLFTRKVKCEINDELSVLHLIEDWLELDTDWFKYNGKYSDTWLWLMQGDMKTAISQIFERLSNIHLWLLNIMVKDKKARCHINNLANMYKYNNYVQHKKSKIISCHQSVMSHHTLIEESINWRWQTTYSLITKNGEKVSIKQSSDDLEYRDFVVEALSDLWFVEPSKLLKGIDVHTMDIPGLLLSVPKHMQDGGEIATYIKSNIAQTVLDCKTPMKDFIIINSKRRQTLQGMLHHTHPHQQIMPTDMLTHLSTCEVLIEQTCMHHWFREQKPSQDHEMVYGGCYLLGLSCNNLYHVKLMKVDQKHHGLLNMNLQWPAYSDMVTSRFKTAEFKPRANEVISDLDKPGILLLGVDIVSYTKDKIIEIFQSNRKLTIVGAVPINTSQNMWYHISKTNHITYKDGTYTRKIVNDLIKHTLNGSPMFIEQDKYISVEVCFEIAEHKVITLTWRKIPACNIINRNLEPIRIRPDIIDITVPWIDFELSNVLKTRSIITVKALQVNTKLLRTLLIRLMTGDDSWDSLLAYARTIESTYIVTENKLDEMQLHNIPELLSTAWYALFIHHNYVGKFKLLSQLVNMSVNHEILRQLLNQVIPGLLRLVNALADVADEQILELINNMAKKLQFNSEALEALNRLEKLEWLEVFNRQRVITYEFSEGSYKVMSHNEISNDTSDEKESDDSDEFTRKINDVVNKFDHFELNENENDSQNGQDNKDNKTGSDESMTDENISDEQEWSSSDSSDDEDDIIESIPDKLCDHLRQMAKDNWKLIKNNVLEVTKINENIKETFLAYTSEGLDNNKPMILSIIDAIWRSVSTKFTEGDAYTMCVDLNNVKTMLEPTQVMEYIKSKTNETAMPKIIWAYWHGSKMPLMVFKMIENWKDIMHDYDVVLVTTELALRLLDNDYDHIKNLEPAHYSDVIRTGLLAKYGGIYLDASCFLTDRIDGLIQQAVNSAEGFFQFSIYEEKELNKSYENWLMIATTNSKYMQILAKHVLEMACADISDSIALQVWLTEKFGNRVAELAVRGVDHSMLYYLRMYTLQQAIIHKYKIETDHCIFSNECPIVFWSCQLQKSWIERVQMMWNCDINDLRAIQPIIKLIKNLRCSLITYDNINGEAVDNSLLENLRNQKLRLNIKMDVGKTYLVQSDVNVDKYEPPKLIPITVKTDVLIICTGSTGDLEPCLVIADLLHNSGKSIAIVTHSDHESRLKSRTPYMHRCLLTITSKTWMTAGISIDDKFNAANIVTANYLHSDLTEQIKLYLDTMANKCELIICTGLVPNIENFLTEYKCKWTITNPFPLEWITGNRSNTVLNKMKNVLAKAAISLKAKLLKATSKQKCVSQHTMLYTYNKSLMIECPHVEDDVTMVIGPLTSGIGFKSISLQKSHKYVVIMMGSCIKYVNHYYLTVIIEYMINKGYHVLIVTGNTSIKPFTHLSECMGKYGDLIECAKEINLRTIKDMVDLVVCHGGAGTVNECVVNKIPLLVYPIFADQPYWADMIELKGFGKRLKDNSIDTINECIETCYRKLLRYKSRLDEDGNAVTNTELLEKWLSQHVSPILSTGQIHASMCSTYGNFDHKDFLPIDVRSMPVKMGVFTTKDFTIDRELSIRTAAYCVSQSFKRVLSVDGLKKYKIITNPSFLNIQTSGVRPDDCINGILSVGINVITCDDDKVTCFNIFPSNPTIIFRFSMSGPHMHCNPVTSLMAKTWRPMVSTIKEDERLSKEVQMSIKEVTCTSDIPSWLYWTPATLIRWLGDQFIKDCKARFSLNAITTIKSRKLETCTYVELISSENCYYCVQLTRDTPIRLGLIMGQQGWTLINYFVKNEILIILTSDAISKHNVLIDLGKPIGKVKPKLTMMTEKSLMVCLNQSTRSYLQSINDMNFVETIYRPGLINYVLLMTTYDNRRHHNVDEQAIINGAEYVLGVNNDLLDTTIFEPTFGRPINRLTMLNGVLYYAIECDTVDTVDYVQSLILGISRIDSNKDLMPSNMITLGTMIYYNQILLDPILEMLLKYVTKSDQKLIQRYNLEPTKNITWAELKITLTKQLMDWNGLVRLLSVLEKNNWNEEDECTVTNREYDIASLSKTKHVQRGYGLGDNVIQLIVANATIRKKTKAGGNMGQENMSVVSVDESHNTGSLSENKGIEITNERNSWKDTTNKPTHDYNTKWDLDTNALRDAIAAKMDSRRSRIKTTKTNQSINVPEFKDVTFINLMTYSDTDYTTLINGTNCVDQDEFIDLYIAPFNHRYCADDVDVVHDWPDLSAINLWSQTDLSLWLTMYAPLNEMRIISHEMPMQIIETEKYTLTKYPQRSRAVLTKVCYEEIRSIAGRLGSVVKIRTKTPNNNYFIYEVAETYFHSNWRNECNNFIKNSLIIDPNEVRQWIKNNKSCPNIVKELIQMLSGELLTKPMNDVNVHLKLESLLKEEPITNWKQQQVRIIVWQRKAVCAIYSSVFIEAKKRLKSLLKSNIIYTDGLRPDEISARLRLVPQCHGFFENDLKKQDRQTDDHIIDLEMRMYILLGVHKNVVSSWRLMHDDWRFKSNSCRGMRRAMRLTGQATTALGNCITNMQVHCNFVKNNLSTLRLALFLGDDMCMVFSEKPNIKDLKKYIATNFNMQSKESWHDKFGTFCSMLVGKLPDGNCQLSPDVVRLKYRYEVTNGVHEVDEVNLLMRAASYLMNIGLTPETKGVIERVNLPIQPIEWYDFNAMLVACAYKYEMTTGQVMAYYNDLLNMIENPILTKHTFRHYTSSTQYHKLKN